MKHVAVFPLIVWFVAFSVLSQDRTGETRTAEDMAHRVKAMVESVHAYVLTHSDDMAAVQRALVTRPDFSDHDRNLYIFIHCYDIEKKEAVCCGQGIRPELVGKNMWHLRTPNGRLLFKEISFMVERDKEGWIDYDWLNPYTRNIQAKRSYFKGLMLKDGRKAWVGCGYWKEKQQQDTGHDDSK